MWPTIHNKNIFAHAKTAYLRSSLQKSTTVFQLCCLISHLYLLPVHMLHFPLYGWETIRLWKCHRHLEWSEVVDTKVKLLVKFFLFPIINFVLHHFSLEATRTAWWQVLSMIMKASDAWTRNSEAVTICYDFYNHRLFISKWQWPPNQKGWTSL